MGNLEKIYIRSLTQDNLHRADNLKLHIKNRQTARVNKFIKAVYETLVSLPPTSKIFKKLYNLCFSIQITIRLDYGFI